LDGHLADVVLGDVVNGLAEHGGAGEW
jgi:hypothetical protein